LSNSTDNPSAGYHIYTDMFHFPYDITLMRKDIHRQLMARYRLKVRLAPFLDPFNVEYSSTDTDPSPSPTPSDTSTIGSFDAFSPSFTSTSTTSSTPSLASFASDATIPPTNPSTTNTTNFPCPLPLYYLPRDTAYSVSPIIRVRSLYKTQLSPHGLRTHIPNPFAVSMQMYESNKQPREYCVKSIFLGADGTVRCERVVNESGFSLAKDLWERFFMLRTGVEWGSRAQAVALDVVEGMNGEVACGKSGLPNPFAATSSSTVMKREEEEELERKRALSHDGAGGGGWSYVPGPKEWIGGAGRRGSGATSRSASGSSSSASSRRQSQTSSDQRPFVTMLVSDAAVAAGKAADVTGGREVEVRPMTPEAGW
jgi:hypothetical protein